MGTLSRSYALGKDDHIDPIPRSIERRDGHIRLIDQSRLPAELVFLDISTVEGSEEDRNRKPV